MRKAAKHTIVTLLFLTLSITTAFLLYLHFFASNDSDLFGEWTADLDMSEKAAVTAFIWLQDIEAVSISLKDMESYMQNLSVQVELTLEQTAHDKGSFNCNVLPESYDACNQAAYEAFATAFRGALAERLKMAGYTENTEEEDIEALVTETFGMSTVSYLMTCGPELLPSFKELQEQYEGSGTYEASEGILVRQFEDGRFSEARSEYYIREDNSLLLFGESVSGSPDYISDFNHGMILYILKQAK